MINGMLPEYMHNVSGGVVALLAKMTFKSPVAGRIRHTRKMYDPKELDNTLMTIPVPIEFHNAARPLHFASWKMEEYRNLLLFYFPAVNQ